MGRRLTCAFSFHPGTLKGKRSWWVQAQLKQINISSSWHSGYWFVSALLVQTPHTCLCSHISLYLHEAQVRGGAAERSKLLAAWHLALSILAATATAQYSSFSGSLHVTDGVTFPGLPARLPCVDLLVLPFGQSTTWHVALDTAAAVRFSVGVADVVS